MQQPSKISEVTILRVLRGLKLMDAETFCDRWFGLDQVPPDDRHQEKQKYGYRAKCVRLLVEVLRVEESTVNAWGSRFDRMPDHYKPALLYADAIRQNLQASAGTSLLDLFLNQQDQNKN